MFLDHSTGFAATGGLAIGTDRGGVYAPIAGGIQRTTDGGETWRTAWTAPGALLSWIGFADHAAGFAAGNLYATSSGTSSPGQPLWLRTTDGGSTWTAFTPKIPVAVARDWAALRFVFATPTLGIGVIDSNWSGNGFDPVMVRTSNGGLDWSPVGLQGWTPTGGVAFVSAREAYATGYQFPVTSGVASQIWASADGGQSWHAVHGPQISFALYAVEFVDRLHGFAAGGNLQKYETRPWRGVIATSDGGRTWSVRYQSPDSDRSNPITRLKFIDVDHGWAAIGGCTMGQNGPCGGAVLATRDGGRSWDATDQFGTQLSPVGPTEAWAVHGGFGNGPLWHTVDTGTSWQAVVRPGAVPITDLAGSQAWLVALTPIGYWNSADDGKTWQPFNPPILGRRSPWGTPQIVVQPPATVIVVDGHDLRMSRDGGLRWTSSTLPVDEHANPATAVAFTDSWNAMAIVGSQLCVKPVPGVPDGSATVLRTTDGGVTWEALTSLARHVTGMGSTNGLAVLTGSVGCGPAQQQSLAISRDGGQHWATQRLPFPCSSPSVVAPSTIWLSCYQDRTVVLVSQDGAQTWTQLEGASPSFLATSATEAWAYGGPGALWHTRDAGRHWAAMVPTF